jgi:hypothetical protein
MDSRLRELRRRKGDSPLDRTLWLRELLKAPVACERCGGIGLATPTGGPKKGRPDYAATCPACAGTGYPLRARVELAAYCGDEAARAVVAVAECRPPLPSGRWESWSHMDEFQALSAWLRGLSRWADVGHAPGWVLVRAAVAAATAFAAHQGLEGWARIECRDPNDAMGPACREEARSELRAIEAAEAWLACPCEEHERAWQAAFAVLPLLWLPSPPSEQASHEAEITQAARLAGEAPVREAIQKALVDWALDL